MHTAQQRRVLVTVTAARYGADGYTEFNKWQLANTRHASTVMNLCSCTYAVILIPNAHLGSDACLLLINTSGARPDARPCYHSPCPCRHARPCYHSPCPWRPPPHDTRPWHHRFRPTAATLSCDDPARSRICATTDPPLMKRKALRKSLTPEGPGVVYAHMAAAADARGAMPVANGRLLATAQQCEPNGAR